MKIRLLVSKEEWLGIICKHFKLQPKDIDFVYVSSMATGVMTLDYHDGLKR